MWSLSSSLATVHAGACPNCFLMHLYSPSCIPPSAFSPAWRDQNKVSPLGASDGVFSGSAECGHVAGLAVSMQLVFGSARASRAANGAPPLAPSPTGGSPFGGPCRRGSIRGGAPRITRAGACAAQFQLHRYGLGYRGRGSGQQACPAASRTNFLTRPAKQSVRDSRFSCQW